MITYEEAIKFYEYKEGQVYRKIAQKGCSKGALVGSMNDRGYMRTKHKGKSLFVHRLIYLLHYKTMPKQIDHINGIKHDNRIENLRESNQNQNMWNRKINSNNTSGVKGVHKEKNRWKVRFKVNNKYYYFGSYDTIEEAKKVIEQKRKELHGEYARHE